MVPAIRGKACDGGGDILAAIRMGIPSVEFAGSPAAITRPRIRERAADGPPADR